jgi:hypothetical protein
MNFCHQRAVGNGIYWDRWTRRVENGGGGRAVLEYGRRLDDRHTFEQGYVGF